MDVSVNWRGRMSFVGTADSGFELPLGASPEVGGDHDGFKPMELMALSLAGCTAMDVLSILRKKRQDITGFEVKVHADRQDEHPRVFTHVVVEYLVEGHSVDPRAIERAIELSAGKYCPAQAMLAQAVEIEHTFTVLEAG